MEDRSKTFRTYKVPETVESTELNKNLAKSGFQVVESNFHHNPITNKRTGDGFIQIRARNDHKGQNLEKEIKASGIKMKIGDKRGRIENRTRRRVGD